MYVHCRNQAIYNTAVSSAYFYLLPDGEVSTWILGF